MNLGRTGGGRRGGDKFDSFWGEDVIFLLGECECGRKGRICTHGARSVVKKFHLDSEPQGYSLYRLWRGHGVNG